VGVSLTLCGVKPTLKEECRSADIREMASSGVAPRGSTNPASGPSALARAYIAGVIAAGAIVLAYGIWTWHTESWARYLIFYAAAIAASRMKVTLPAGAGTLSLNFVFILIGLASLSLGETLVMGSSAILAQRLFHAQRRPTTEQLLFNSASMACSIGLAYYASRVGLGTGWFDPPILLLFAAATFFTANTFSVALVIGLTEKRSPWAIARESYLWSFPNYLVGAAIAWGVSVLGRTFGWQASLITLPVLYIIYRSHRAYVERLAHEKRRAEEQRIHAEELASLHRRTIETLALAIEAKDQTTHDHLARVEVYALEIGKDLGLSESELQALQAAALLHDIGKLAVPEYIISKPGKLTPEEFEKMKIHPVVGAELVERVRFPYPVAPIVRSHHEKWDGSGYPDGLEGEQIPIGARILSTVDCLDALASDRQYRRAMPLEEAIGVVRMESGKAFDPSVVEVLSRRYVELERKAKASGMGKEGKLSTDIKIERGASPGAGFEEAAGVRESGLLRLNESLVSDDSNQALVELLDTIEACGSREEVYEVLRGNLAGLVPYQTLVVYWRAGEVLRPECLEGQGSEAFASLEIPLGMGLSGWVAENGKPILNGNPSVEPGYLNDPTKFSTLGSALGVPLELFGGINGVLALYRRQRDAFSNAELRLLQSVARKIGKALELSRV
jgi:putative nucleotidyltransferase with HDIG domain